MRRYLRRILLFFSPLFAVLVLYFVLDPFKVLYDYKMYYTSGKPDYVVLNRGYVSTETFVHQHPRERYDSFIFGNSRSLFWQVRDWKPHLHAGASCFHFDGSDESLYSLHRKVRFLDEHHVHIAHALLVVDYSLLAKEQARQGHLIVTPPRLVKYRNLPAFHGEFLLAYLDPHFLLAYYDFTLTGQFRDYMRDHNILNAEPMHYTPQTNEISYPQFETAIEEGRYYDEEKLRTFSRSQRNPGTSPVCLGAAHIRLLREIRNIFASHGTTVRIVISPMYNQRALHPTDVATLRRVFGDAAVADYSGVNDITEDYRNYYELSHYRPHVAARIMREIYSTGSGRRPLEDV